jgi:hypothetical protein
MRFGHEQGGKRHNQNQHSTASYQCSHALTTVALPSPSRQQWPFIHRLQANPVQSIRNPTGISINGDRLFIFLGNDK